MSDEDLCAGVQNEDTFLNLRIAAVFVVLVTSGFGACFPIWAKDRKFIPSVCLPVRLPPQLRHPSSDPSLTRIYR
jgi:hypothetical protein